MRKRRLATLLTLVLLMTLVPASVPVASALDVYDDWEYSGDAVCGYVGTAETVSVPSVINGTPITRMVFSGSRQYSSSLTNISIPNNITVIVGGILNEYRNLMNINVAPDNPNYTSIDGVLYSKDTTRILSFPSGRTGSFTIPDHVTIIGGAEGGEGVDYDPSVPFAYSRLTSVIIPDSVTFIAGGAFRDSSLTSLTIPSSVTYIAINEVNRLYESKSLTSINVDPNNPEYSSVDGVLYNKNQTVLIHYPVGKPDASFIMPNSVTSVENSAFSGSSLTSVTISNKVIDILPYAFLDCGNLTSVTIPNSVKYIYEMAFFKCYSLETVYFASATPPALELGISPYRAFCDVAPGARAIVPYGATAYGPVGSIWGSSVEYNGSRQDGLIVAYDRSEWASPELERAAEIGLIPESLQGPGIDYSRPVTRAEFAGIAVRTYEILSGTAVLPAINDPFTDTSGTDVLKAYNAGIMVGMSDTTFEPYTRLNREQAATALTRVFKRATIPAWSFASDAGYPLSFTYPAPFADDAQISEWARESVYFMNANGIIQGMGGNMFQPRATTSEQEAQGYATATREQAIAIALRMIENLG